ncbi:MAG TPA: hypothetical protein VFU55_02050 [Terracidiphilus sp.]|nr:hypothetical protein [Terracidiphilus sp.]
MKSALLLAVAAVIISSVPLLAHQTATGAQSPASASAQGTAGASAATPQASATADANSSATAAASMRPVHAELMRGIDSKSAHVGQAVTAKTTQSFLTADGTQIPKGSQLIGHVTQVQAHGHGHSASSLGIVFDHARLKGGQSLPIHSMIESVSPSASALALANADHQESMDAMAPIGGGPAMGSRGGTMARGSGGLAGGAVNSATSATGNLAGNVSSLNNSANGALHSTGNLAANTAGSLNGAASQTAGAAASLGTHATAIPGVMLRSTASGATSGVLSASGRNVHLDSGTQMVLGVAEATGR